MKTTALVYGCSARAFATLLLSGCVIAGGSEQVLSEQMSEQVLEDSLPVSGDGITGFLASRNMAAAVRLTWETVDAGITGFTILRNGEQIVTLDAGARAFADTTVAPGTLQIPALTASQGSNPQGVDLSWALPEAVPGPAYDYQIRVQRSDVAGQVTPAQKGHAAPPTVTGVSLMKNGAPLAALALDAASAFDNTGAVTYGAVRNLAAEQGARQTGITVTWEAEDLSGGAASYLIEWQTDSGLFRTAAVQGWRGPADLTERVVYREGAVLARLASEQLSLDDTTAEHPSGGINGLTASTNNQAQVNLNWTVGTPGKTEQLYEIDSIFADGTVRRAPGAIGWRAVPTTLSVMRNGSFLAQSVALSTVSLTDTGASPGNTYTPAFSARSDYPDKVVLSWGTTSRNPGATATYDVRLDYSPAVIGASTSGYRAAPAVCPSFQVTRQFPSAAVLTSGTSCAAGTFDDTGAPTGQVVWGAISGTHDVLAHGLRLQSNMTITPPMSANYTYTRGTQMLYASGSRFMTPFVTTWSRTGPSGNLTAMSATGALDLNPDPYTQQTYSVAASGAWFGQASQSATIPFNYATGVAAGSGFSCASLSDRSIRCWGARGTLIPDSMTNVDRVLANDQLFCRIRLDGTPTASCSRGSTAWPDWTFPAAASLNIAPDNICYVVAGTTQMGCRTTPYSGYPAPSGYPLHDFALGQRGSDNFYKWAAISRNESNVGVVHTTGPYPLPLFDSEDVRSIRGSDSSACKQLGNGTVYCHVAKLGPTTLTKANADTYAVGRSAACIRVGNTIDCLAEKLSAPTGTWAWDDIAISHNHGCGTLQNGTVRCWGNNTSGQAPP